MDYKNEIDGQVKNAIENGYEFSISKYFEQGWRICKNSLANYMILIGVAFVLMAIFGAGVFLLVDSGDNVMNWMLNYPAMFFLISLLFTVFTAPLKVGIYLIAHEKEQNGSSSILHFFDGYKDFVQLVLATLVIYIPSVFLNYFSAFIRVPNAVVSVLSMMLGVLFLFSSLLIVVNRYSFLTALKASALLISKKFAHVLLFYFLIVVLNILGALFAGLGLLITIPLTVCAIYAFFEDVCISSEQEEVNLEDNLIEL